MHSSLDILFKSKDIGDDHLFNGSFDSYIFAEKCKHQSPDGIKTKAIKWDFQSACLYSNFSMKLKYPFYL